MNPKPHNIAPTKEVIVVESITFKNKIDRYFFTVLWDILKIKKKHLNLQCNCNSSHHMKT